MISTYLEFWNMALGQNDPFLRVWMIICITSVSASYIYLALSYILSSLSLHTIAKNRGILHPWLAWIPVGNLWILGSISDKYQSEVNGKQRRRRILLLWLPVAGIATFVLALVSGTHMTGIDQSFEIPLLIAYVITLLSSVAAFNVTTVFAHISLYDVYKSCVPERTMAYLMVGIFVNVTPPFFLLSCRKQELRKEEKVESEEQIGDCAEENDLL